MLWRSSTSSLSSSLVDFGYGASTNTHTHTHMHARTHTQRRSELTRGTHTHTLAVHLSNKYKLLLSSSTTRPTDGDDVDACVRACVYVCTVLVKIIGVCVFLYVCYAILEWAAPGRRRRRRIHQITTHSLTHSLGRSLSVSAPLALSTAARRGDSLKSVVRGSSLGHSTSRGGARSAIDANRCNKTAPSVRVCVYVFVGTRRSESRDA